MAFNFDCVGEECAQMFTNFSNESFIGGVLGGFAGGAIGGIFAVLGIFALLLVIALYVYHSLAWATIAKKQKHKYPWLAWIPFASTAMRLQLGGFHWALIFLLLIPFLGWIAIFVLLIIAMWKIFEKEKYPGWFSLSVIIPQIGAILYLIAIGLVAWRDK